MYRAHPLRFALREFMSLVAKQSDGSPSLDRVIGRADMQNPSESSQVINDPAHFGVIKIRENLHSRPPENH